jgi:predicted nucleic acid-binding protein
VSLYLDTSCLLKMLFPEPETSRVIQLVAGEEHVVVSSLARLETLVQVHARTVGGLLTRAAARSLIERLDELLRRDPYEVVRTPTEIVDLAEGQVRPLPRRAYCPTLDRLHLAVMRLLDLHRLLTNDGAQARAARAIGFSAVVPR